MAIGNTTRILAPARWAAALCQDDYSSLSLMDRLGIRRLLRHLGDMGWTIGEVRHPIQPSLMLGQFGDFMDQAEMNLPVAEYIAHRAG